MPSVMRIRDQLMYGAKSNKDFELPVAYQLDSSLEISIFEEPKDTQSLLYPHNLRDSIDGLAQRGQSSLQL
jgi:hypothetical protein